MYYTRATPSLVLGGVAFGMSALRCFLYSHNHSGRPLSGTERVELSVSRRLKMYETHATVPFVLYTLLVKMNPNIVSCHTLTQCKETQHRRPL